MDRRRATANRYRVILVSIQSPNVIVSPGSIRSLDYDDIYFSDDAEREVNRVFLEPAKIKERMKYATVFSVGELGFGSGLNFLTTANIFVKSAPETGRLRFISFEKHPLSKEDVLTALSSFTFSSLTLGEFADALPSRTRGWHRRFFLDGKIELSVYVGDVEVGIKDLLHQEHLGIDAWFLDGFSPAKNPAMWSPTFLQQIAPVTRKKGTITSFSAAGEVRRVLSLHFHVERVDGRPYKRHTLLATLARKPLTEHPKQRSVRVLGAGIAGCSTAFALARKGLEVELVDPSGIATKTSSISTAILHPRLFSGESKESDFRTNAYTYAQNAVKSMQSARRTGSIQLPYKTFGKTRLISIYEKLGRDWAEPFDQRDLIEFGIKGFDFAIFFKRSLIIDVAELCNELLRKYHIKVSQQASLPANPELPLVIATSRPPSYLQSPPLETSLIDGQVDFFKLPARKILKTTIVHNGYIAPHQNGRQIAAGSTYERLPQSVPFSSLANRSRLNPIFGHSNYRWHSRFRATRTVTSDRFPIIGKISPNIWLNIAHGSSGTITGIFGAEHIASEICGELSPFCKNLQSVVDPSRFERRQLRRPNPLQFSQPKI